MIELDYTTHPELYVDYRKCLDFLSTIDESQYEYPEEKINFHLSSRKNPNISYNPRRDQGVFCNLIRSYSISFLLKPQKIELEEIGSPLPFKWEKCKLETVSYGHGITTTPIQAAAAYAAITNGGYLINPTLVKKDIIKSKKSVISEETSNKMNKILRKVVSTEEGTATLADIFGYDVGGKTGTSKKYNNENKNINTFISIFPSQNPKYVLLVILDDPKGAPHITYKYKGHDIKNISRNEAGWNSVYITGKIIKKIGPILAINNKEIYNGYVAKKSN